MIDDKFIELNTIIKREYGNIAGLLIKKDNNIIYENYYNGFNDKSTIHVASVTKSIISILIGIAINQGCIKSINQKVLDFFPEYVIKKRENTIQKITIRNLLTMTAPYKYKYEPHTKVYSSEDWSSAVLDLLGGKQNTGEFTYSTIGTQLLSGILTYATGQSVLSFTNENLFDPLGINSPNNVRINNKEEHFAFLKNKNVSGWVVDPKNVNTAGWGLTLTTMDMMKIGQLFLDKGIYKGKQIIDANWIDECTKEHSRWGELPYGYLWWIVESENINSYAALGDGGNIIYVSPYKKLVIAITSEFMPRAKDRIDLIKKHIEIII